ncbi:LacI family DNA-binding transcriptional regulator [Paenibacillus ehimensis]|uniref:LacI family DNA-binding transcriptional regulator n=1 Tax=Paenibacillus ehimensis TaxID=79264 RepID=A0ABT8V2I3_9BACL|nr:LacI family DNA-binding transcriptional regulator [Paenibacillus ehimensis]MDO3675627.1 LacI family DNA-binding transcriptional regulator [Paenibacillus ehimensis]MEC0212570.1 LacI family DNA-binding transcriptional regulator [Paenibacillus ehimensis]
MPKIEDVAAKAGVSVTTVSRVLNNRGYISQATRDKVSQAMKELNYQPNEMARSLFRKKSNMIGLIIPTVSHPFFSELVYHLEYYADQNGYKVLLCNSNRDISKERKYIDMLKKNQVDAIVMGSNVLDVKHYLNLNLPIISFDRTVANNIPIVTSDNYMGGKLASRLLIDKGCRKLAYIYGGIGGPHHAALLASKRFQGFMDELQDTGIEQVSLELELTDLGDKRNVDELVRFFQEHPDADGVFATSDAIAALVIQACHQLKKTIPQAMKIVGYDDVGIATLVSPRLTTIRQPIREMSECAIELIVKQLEGEKVSMINSFPVTLMQRDTT